MSKIAAPINNIQGQPQPEMLAHQSPFKKWAGLGVLSLGLAIIIIDTTLLNVSLATIIKDLHTDLQSIQWVITAYALMLAAFTITGGRFGDLFGRKKMFMLGAAIFAVGSFLASVAHSMPILLLGESIIEGIGAALMMPATASLVVANFHGKDRATAFGVWGGVAGASSAIGPLLGGYLTSHFSWRWGFRINVFVAAIVILGSLLLIAESKDERKPKLDWGGVALSALGLLGLAFGIIESATYGWWKAKTIFSAFGHAFNFPAGLSVVPWSLAIGILFLILFFFWERYREKNGKTPLVYLELFKNRQFTAGSLTVMMLTLGMTGIVFALPVFLQAVKNLDAFHTGLALLPMSATMLVVAPLSGLLSKKISPKYLIQIGLAVEVAAMFVLRAALGPNVTVGHLVPGLILYGAGIGSVMAPISNLTLSAVDVHQAGEASGVNNTLRQVGATLGTAIIGAAVLTVLTTSLSSGIRQSVVIPDPLKKPLIQTLSNPNSNVEFGLSDVPAQVPDPIKNEITVLAKKSSTKASKDAFVYAAMFAALAFVVSLFIAKTNVDAHEMGRSVVDESQLEYTTGKWVAAAVLAAAVLFGAFFIIKRSDEQIATTNSTASSSGRNPLTEIPRAHLQIRGPETAQTTPPLPDPNIYTNQVLKFKVELPPAWRAQEKPPSQVELVGPAGKTIKVEAYTSVTNQLSIIESELKGSPSVKNLRRTIFQGDEAVSFQTDGGQNGIAVIHSNKLYYIIGNALSSFPLTTFSFM